MRFDADGRAIAAFARSPAVARRVERTADAIAATAKADAPYRNPKHKSFANSIDATPARVDSQGAVASVTSSDTAAHLIEFGSVNNAPFAPFRNAVRSLGLRLEDRGRH